MTTPLDPTSYPPEWWQEYLNIAMAALRSNHQDKEALDAIRMANQALGAYDQAEAASPGERISAGFTGGVKGLGQAAVDLPKGIVNTILHPVETVQNLPKLPGALAEGISSDDPSQVARTVGNIGGLLAPFAKTSSAAGAPTVGGAVMSGLKKPFQAGAELLRRPALKNTLIEQQTATAAARTQAAQAQAARAPLQDQLAQGRVQGQGLRNQALQQGIDQTATTNPINQGILQQRLEMITQQLEQMPAGAEKLGLTNELLRLRIQLLEQKLNGGEGGVEGGGSEPPPTPKPPLTPIPGTPMGPNGPRGFNGPEGVSPPAKPAQPSLHEQINGPPIRDVLNNARAKYNSGNAQDLIPTGGVEPMFEEGAGPASLTDLMSFTKHMPGVPEVDLMQYINQFAKSLTNGKQPR